jgi:hypothetical protein
MNYLKKAARTNPENRGAVSLLKLTQSPPPRNGL